MRHWEKYYQALREILPEWYKNFHNFNWENYYEALGEILSGIEKNIIRQL